MANGQAHRIVAAVAVSTVLGQLERAQEEKTMRPLAGGALAVALANLPDVIEPACHPHHRQFFHSVAFAGLLGWGTYKVYQWKPESDDHKLLRFALLVGASAYLIHLAVDATSARSLPLVGNL